MATSRIEWTQATWNPTTGCQKVSPGCKHCYAERMANRLRIMGIAKYDKGFRFAVHEEALQIPLNWKKPKLIFVNSMSDLFYEKMPFDFLCDVFDVMRRAYWHQFQILTKRSEQLYKLSPLLDWPQNVWMGVSVENQDYMYRVEHLTNSNAHTKFLSLEPLLGPLPNLNLQGIDWVIVGGESGPGARPMLKDWALDIRNQCLSAKVPFFFKQWGGVNKKKTGRKLQGRNWNQMPRITAH